MPLNVSCKINIYSYNGLSGESRSLARPAPTGVPRVEPWSSAMHWLSKACGKLLTRGRCWAPKSWGQFCSLKCLNKKITVIAFQYAKHLGSSRKGKDGGGGGEAVTTQICKTPQRRPGVKYFRGVTFLVTGLTNSGSVSCTASGTQKLMFWWVEQTFRTSDTM